MGAAHLADRRLEELSSGERQRAALAAVLAAEPVLLLLDEPTSQLDDEGARRLAAILRAVADRGAAVIVSEHRIDRVAPIADRVLSVSGGRVGGGGAEDEPAAAAVPGDTGAVALSAAGLVARRGGRAVLAGADLEVRRGEAVALVGPNGCGKTTLMRLLAGLDRPEAGRILLAGRDVTAVPPEQRFPTLSLLPQDPGRHLLCERADDEAGLGLTTLGSAARRRPGSAAPPCWRSSACRTRARGTRATCRWASGSGWRSPPPSPRTPSCCSWTSPRGAWTRRGGPSSRRSCAPGWPAARRRSWRRTTGPSPPPRATARWRCATGGPIPSPSPGATPAGARGVSPASTLALSGLALLAAGLFAFERRRFDPRALALAATLAALATAGRVLVPIPSAKPVTAVCLLAGICLGPASGAAVGASTALLSNAFLGQGPWTPWQMLLWGLIGVAGGLLGPVLRNRTALVAAGAIAALAFGACMNVWQLATFGPELSLQAFVVTQSASLPFDITHAVATALILAVIGPASIRLLDRYAVRLEGHWAPGPNGRSRREDDRPRRARGRRARRARSP